jgi:hypothetical protein
VVENPVTLVLYNQTPFSNPYRTLNVSTPEYGPQLIKILSASILLDSIMIGATTWGLRVGQAEEDELEVELEPEPAHVGPVIVLPFNVTVAAACDKIRPFNVAPAFMAVVSATLAVTTFPLNEVVVPKVAALPILHHTLQESPPVTDEPDDVTSVVPVLKMWTPEPVRVKFPVSVKAVVAQ